MSVTVALAQRDEVGSPDAIERSRAEVVRRHRGAGIPDLPAGPVAQCFERLAGVALARLDVCQEREDRPLFGLVAVAARQLER